MIEYTRGDMLASGLDSLVDPVNCLGVSGKGLALAFKHACPDAVSMYERSAKLGLVRVGFVPCCWTLNMLGGRTGGTLVYFFPTKRDWRHPSRIEWIWAGLMELAGRVAANYESGVQSIGIPALGCGLGGLDFTDVRAAIEAAFADSPARVVVYEP